MSGKESVSFTVKGPVSMQPIENNGDYQGRKVGCAIIDLFFQSPSQIGEILLSNYYTAWISIYVKRAPPKTIASSSSSNKPVNSSGAGSTRSRPNFERSVSVDFTGLDSRSNGKLDGKEDLLLLEAIHSSSTSGCSSANSNMSSRRRHSSGPNSAEVTDRPWECSVPAKTLMPFPHFEAGSQDVFSIPATESLVELRDIIIMRLVLHQPSSVWKRFSVEDINVFKNLPKRGFPQLDDLSRQREGWLATLRINTKKMLGGQLVEPEKYESDEGEI